MMGAEPNNKIPSAPERFKDRCCTYYPAVLGYFHSHSIEVATIDDLVSYIRAQDEPRANDTQIATYLHHITLPRLADAGCIDYDTRSNTARYRRDPSATSKRG